VALIALILGVGLRLWLYNTVIVDTFYTAPAQLAAAVVGASDPGGDHRCHLGQRRHGGRKSVAKRRLAVGRLWLLPGRRRGVVSHRRAVRLCDVPDRLVEHRARRAAGAGPLFIALLFFDATRRFFTAWIAQLANYGLITILTVMVAALLLKIVQSYAAQTAARGAAILTVDALNMMLIALLVFLVLRQVMPSHLAWPAAHR